MVGHLFQGRYKSILVQKDSYLLELTRYVILNPIRGSMVTRLEDWPWSSYPAVTGLVVSPEWLDTDGLLSQFGKRRKTAIERYHQFALQGKGLPSPLNHVRHQLLLGDDDFVERYREDKKPEELSELSKAHRRSLALPLSEYEKNITNAMLQRRMHIFLEPIRWQTLVNISAYTI